MPRIVSVQSSQNGWNKILGLWQYFQSFESFTKVTILTSLLIIASTPFIVGNRQVFTPEAEVSGQTDIVFPVDAGIINVKDYGAKGDGVTDDTAAIQKVISDNIINNKGKGSTVFIYFPAGTYIVSNTLFPKEDSTAEGGWSSYLTLQGQHRDKSIIKLKDNAPGYGSKSTPKAVLFTASSCFVCGTNRDWTGKAEGNEAFNNNIFDLTVDIGTGNQGAIGIDYLASNNGEVRDVKIVSGDGEGYTGLSLIRKWPGPALVKNILIEGFDHGIHAGYNQYGMTFEHITLNNQKVAGIRNDDNVVSMRDLKSTNSVPVIQNTGTQGLVTLIDGSFTGGSPSVSAIENNAGELFARNIAATGYQSAIKNKGSVISGQSISEFVSNGPYSLFPSTKNSLNLQVQDPPEIPWDPLDKWVNVQDYGADGSGKKDFDNSPAVQKAIDAANTLGKTTLYFPKGRYAFGDTIHIRGNIRRVHFMMSGLGVVNSAANKFGDERPFLQIEEGNHPAIVLEGVGRPFGTGATVGPRFAFKHISPKTLVFKNLGGTYENVPGSGPVFFEDMQTCGIFRSTKVWARQLDPEGGCSKDPNLKFNPYILNDGSDVWILGIKTEGPATIVETKNGGRTEVLGGLIYPVGSVPADMPAFINRDSSHSLSFVIKADNTAGSHQVVIEETRDAVTRQLLKSQVPPRGNGVIVPFFAGYVLSSPTPSPIPTSAPTQTPTLTPSIPIITATPTPTLTPTLTPTPCQFTSASWSTTTASEGDTVTLTVSGNSSCDGKQVNFEVRENDSILEGIEDDPVLVNPGSNLFIGTVVTSTWASEWQNDCAGLCNPPEYYFNAALVEDSSTTIKSADPLLEVNQVILPSYNTPSYDTPSYGTPSYGTPSYETPSYGTPFYGTPSTSGENTSDLNKDSKVNIFDLSILLRNWNKEGQGDLNSDGKVNIFDLSVLLRNWNK